MKMSDINVYRVSDENEPGYIVNVYGLDGTILDTYKTAYGSTIRPLPEIMGADPGNVALYIDETTGNVVNAPYPVTGSMDIKAYQFTQAEYDSLYGDVSEEKLILSLDNLTDKENNIENGWFRPVRLVQNTAMTADGDVAMKVDSVENQKWYATALTTNIPLDPNLSYKITFTAGDVYNGLSHWAYGYTGGLKDNISDFNGFGHKGDWGSLGDVNGLDENYTKVVQTNVLQKKGLHKYEIQISSGYICLNIDGDKAGVWKINTFSANIISIGAYAFTQSGATPDPTNLLTIKDIKIYKIPANTDLRFKIDFYDTDGEVIDTRRYLENTYCESFPEVTPKNEGNIIKWFYKGSNTVVNLPFKLEPMADGMVIEAREIEHYSSKVTCYQYTHRSSQLNTFNVRFIATLHSLQGSAAGFEITAKYMDNGALATKEWDKQVSSVYTSVIAGNDETVTSVTAAELGGTYLMLVALNDVSSNIGQIDFYVRSYVVVDNEKIYSEQIAISFVNGVHAPDVALQ